MPKNFPSLTHTQASLKSLVSYIQVIICVEVDVNVCMYVSKVFPSYDVSQLRTCQNLNAFSQLKKVGNILGNPGKVLK